VNPSSIRFRLTAWYALVLAVTIASAGGGVWLTLRKSVHDTVDRDLDSRLVRMREFLDHLEGGVSKIAAELGEESALAPSGTQFRLADFAGNWIYESPDARKWDLPAPPTQGQQLTATYTVNGKPVRILTAPVSAGIIQIGLPLETFYAMLNAFTWTLIVASPLVLILASAGGYWMSLRALQPVDEIAGRAQEISAQNLSGRLPLRGTGDELDHLSDVLNDMLSRLESAFRRMTQFTADASHELRTPLSIVQTTAEITLSLPRSPAEHARAWKLVLAESERTASLIDDLMTLARADSGTDGMVFEAMDLAECVRNACRDMGILFDTAGLHVRVDLPEQCRLTGDSEALRRLCLILLDNAIKYTPGGGEVRVTLDVCEEGDRTVAVMDVKDTGVGISTTDQQSIFDRFYRVSKDRSRKNGGAGLGLAIAQWIASRHHGAIAVASTPGIGSTFRVTLPAA
jgi:heavy metal sensor kinase